MKTEKEKKSLLSLVLFPVVRYALLILLLPCSLLGLFFSSTTDVIYFPSFRGSGHLFLVHFQETLFYRYSPRV